MLSQPCPLEVCHHDPLLNLLFKVKLAMTLNISLEILYYIFNYIQRKIGGGGCALKIAATG